MPSQYAPSTGHQTETWDTELVPDARGQVGHPRPDCPVEVALDAITGRWTTLVLRELMHGPRSFSELRADLPALSAKVLTERLRHLTSRGLVSRELVREFPARTTYRLTPRGEVLRPLLVTLYAVGSELLEHRGLSG